MAAVGIFGDDVFGNVGQAANMPDAVGTLLGAIAGIAGAGLAGRFGAIRGVLAVLQALLTRAVVAVAGAVSITANESLTSAREIARIFQNNGVPTTLEEGQLIVQEVRSAPEVRTAVQDLAQAGAALRAAANATP